MQIKNILIFIDIKNWLKYLKKKREKEFKNLIDLLKSLNEFKSDNENDIEEDNSVFIYDTIKYPPNVKPHDEIFWFWIIYKIEKLKFKINTSLKWMNNYV